MAPMCESSECNGRVSTRGDRYTRPIRYGVEPMRIGAHVSTAGGPLKAFERAAAVGAEAIQLFISAPQQWKAPAISAEVVAAFNDARQQAAVPVFFHGVYLINLASQDEALAPRSVDSLASYLDFGARMGVEGTIFHVGSHLGRGMDEACVAQVSRLLKQVLDRSPAESKLILECNAGQGGCIGGTFTELGLLIREAGGDPRLAVCIDTCHAFAMGYDIRTNEGCAAVMAEFERDIGLERLVAVHANDSKQPLGGLRDRHENIGDGHIGLDGFAAVMRHKAFAAVPFLLEVPGLSGAGPDIENVMRLKAIRAGIGLPPA
ncbi:MAG: hypothetical protein C0506_08195 [Anaerolinea sp.]|nr:hypothetical protein [Anaerolinea sp.]